MESYELMEDIFFNHTPVNHTEMLLHLYNMSYNMTSTISTYMINNMTPYHSQFFLLLFLLYLLFRQRRLQTEIDDLEEYVDNHFAYESDSDSELEIIAKPDDLLSKQEVEAEADFDLRLERVENKLALLDKEIIELNTAVFAPSETDDKDKDPDYVPAYDPNES